MVRSMESATSPRTPEQPQAWLQTVRVSVASAVAVAVAVSVAEAVADVAASAVPALRNN